MAAAPDCPSCVKLRIELEALRAELRDLRARLNLTSRNSSKPPSSDPPSAPPRPSSPPTGRKQGGQPGHPGVKRQEFSASEIDHTARQVPAHCSNCKLDFTPDAVIAGPPEIRQVVDIPPSVAEVTEYQLVALCCPRCLEATRGEMPAGLSGLVGPRLQALMAVVSGKFRLSRRETAQAAIDMFGPKARISAGWVSELEDRTSQALAHAHEEAHEAVQGARLVHADETSFPQRNKKGWLWTASTVLIAFFVHHAARSRKAAEQLLGQFSGILVVDRWVSYRYYTKRLRQICLAHLKRNFQELVDRGRPAEVVGKAGLSALAAVFDLWVQYEQGHIRFESLARRTAPIRVALKASLTDGRGCPDSKAAALSKDLLKLFECMWTFTRNEGVPLTNNLAERRIRPAVLWRKGSFGTQSDRGSRFVERILTVVQTLKLQGRSAVEFIEQSIRADATGSKPPPLLPA